MGWHRFDLSLFWVSVVNTAVLVAQYVAAVMGHSPEWNVITATSYGASFLVAGPGRWADTGKWPEFGPAIRVTRGRVRLARRVARGTGAAFVLHLGLMIGLSSDVGRLNDLAVAAGAIICTALCVLGAIQHGLGMRYVFGDDALQLLYDESLEYPEQPPNGD